MPPTREATTGLAFHIGSVTVRANPLLQALLHHYSGVALERVDDGRVLVDVVIGRLAKCRVSGLRRRRD
jgi:hypothetical protein